MPQASPLVPAGQTDWGLPKNGTFFGIRFDQIYKKMARFKDGYNFNEYVCSRKPV